MAAFGGGKGGQWLAIIHDSRQFVQIENPLPQVVDFPAPDSPTRANGFSRFDLQGHTIHGFFVQLECGEDPFADREMKPDSPRCPIEEVD